VGQRSTPPLRCDRIVVDGGVGLCGGGWGGAYSIRTVFILPADASWGPCCDQAGHEIGGLGREVQRGGPVGVFADAVVFVAGVDEEFLDIGVVA